MASKQFNITVVGYGLSAKVFHIPFILALPEDFELYGIVQRSPKPNDDASLDHPGTKIFRSVDEVYADPAVDVVVVTSVPDTHFAMCKSALEAGKHVVVEKPFVASAEEAAELVKVAKAMGGKLAVYQNRRWDADFLTVKQLIADGVLGDIAEFETHFDRHRPDPPPSESWKNVVAPSHGALYDLGTHLIDQAYSLFGMPKRVTGFVGVQRRGMERDLAPDSFTALLHYPGPMLVTAKAAVVSPEEEQLRFWVRGTKGGFKKFHLDVQEDQLRLHGMKPGHQDFGVEPKSHHGTVTTVKYEKAKPVVTTHPTVHPATWLEYYRLFAKSLRGEGQVPVKAEEARDVLAIIEALKTSSKEERTVEV